MKQAYDALADWFEYLNDDCGYEEWSQYLISVLRENGAGKVGLDIGCGSGYFTRALQKNGFSMTGFDISMPMLEKAEILAKEQGMSVPFICQDVISLKTFARADFIISVNDCFNYVKKDSLLKAFKRINGSLKKGGLFFFDISSEKKLRSLPPVSIDDREEVTYFSFNTIKEDSVSMDVSLFIKQGESYTRSDETHTQFIYTKEEIELALKEAGFQIIFVKGHLNGDVKTADRLEFLARRM